MDASGQPPQEPSARASLEGKGTTDNGADSWRHYRPLVTVVIAASAGIVLDRHLGGRTDRSATASFTAWWALAASLLIAWWMLWQARRDKAAVWLLLMAIALSAAAWHHLRWYAFGRQEIARYARYDAGPACIEAVARETPERVSAPQATPLRAIPAGETSRLLVEVMRVRNGSVWREASGVCQVQVNGHLLGVHAGDRIRIFGQLARPRPPLNPGEFDFAAHARADRQLARLRSTAPECVSVLARGSPWTAASVLDVVRNGGKRLVREQIGPERAGLASAILLGAREGLPYDQTEPYLVTGTIHVLVVSGMNVAILAIGLLGLIRVDWLSRRVGLTVIIVTVLGYALVTEVQPPVVRAATFGILMCIAAWAGRRGVAFNSLAAAALVVLAINPADLFRAGPQLSFLAVATFVWIGNQGGLIPSGPSDWVDRMFAVDQPWYVRSLVRWARTLGWLGGPPDRLEQMIITVRPWYLRSLASCGGIICWLVFASLIVWFTTLPLVMSQFHVASPIAVVISPAVWLFAIVAMWSGFLMLVFGGLVPFVGAWCGAVCSSSLGGLEHVVAWAESVPVGHFWAPGPAWWWLLGFYLALLTAMLWGRALAPPRWQLAALCAWILIGLAPPLWRFATRDALECSFVAVGHGTCVVLETPTGETLLYDAGALGSPDYATQSIASFLWHRGIMRIDGVVISHADVDHYNALPGLLERFRVGTVYVSPVMFDGFGDGGRIGGPHLLRQAIRDAGVPIREIFSGDQLKIGPEVKVDVLHPPRAGVVGSDNANSITLAVEYRGRRVLLPGDLESPGLDDVMAEQPYDCDALLAPHHGSRQSDPPGFAAWSTPEWVVISGGPGDEVAPVIATYQHAGALVVRTHEAGLVRFSIDSDGLRMASRSAGGLGSRRLPVAGSAEVMRRGN